MSDHNSGQLIGLLDLVIGDAQAGEGVEAFAVDETEMTVRAYGGAVESLSSARTRGIGIRVVAGGRVGYGYTADVTEESVRQTLVQARDNASVATPDEANALPAAAEAEPLTTLYDPAFADVSVKDKVALVIELEAATRSFDRIKGCDFALYGDAVTVAAIASTAGLRTSYRRCDAYVAVEALGEAAGATTAAYALALARLPQQLDIGAVAEEAAVRAARLLGGQKPASRRLPVVLDPYATASLLEVLGSALTADAVQKGRSLFAGKVGQRIAASGVTLVDDGRRADGPAASPWDGEGVPTGRTALVEDGVLQGYLHNTYTAAKDGVASTGNANRSGFKSPPGVSPSNLFLAPGDTGPDALLAGIGEGFYCQQIMGVHSGANPVSGDISVGAAGLMVRDGQFAEPVREASIASTIPDILRGIVAVGSDLRFFPMSGGMGAVTLLIEEMSLSGA